MMRKKTQDLLRSTGIQPHENGASRFHKKEGFDYTTRDVVDASIPLSVMMNGSSRCGAAESFILCTVSVRSISFWWVSVLSSIHDICHPHEPRHFNRRMDISINDNHQVSAPHLYLFLGKPQEL